MSRQIFLSPQVKWIVIISNKHGINELSHDLPNDPHDIFADGGDQCPHKKKKDLGS